MPVPASESTLVASPPPDAGAAAAAWANCDDVVAAMVRRRHLGQRLRMHLSPRTALHRDRLRSNQ